MEVVYPHYEECTYLKLHCPMSVEKMNTSLVNDYQDVAS